HTATPRLSPVSLHDALPISGAPAGCETQAVDEVGDLRIYEVSGRVAPLCPGQYATLTEQQLHDALFLPALQLSRDEPAAVLQPGDRKSTRLNSSHQIISYAV